MNPQRIASAKCFGVTQAKSASSTGYWPRCFLKQSMIVLVLDPAILLRWSIPVMMTPGTKESEFVDLFSYTVSLLSALVIFFFYQECAKCSQGNRHMHACCSRAFIVTRLNCLLLLYP
jgi:hypothetical protein